MKRSELMKKLDLLIVEDDPDMAKAEIRHLKKHWKSITLTRDASEGLQAIATGNFDVALSDWDCPNGGGEQVVKDSSIPVVIHTGNPEVPNMFHDVKVVMKPAKKDAINNALLEAYLNFGLI